MGKLPDWLAPDAVPIPVPAPSIGGGRELARKGLGVLVSTAATMFDLEDADPRSAWLRRIDARAKILGLLGLLVAATLVQGLLSLAACIAATWALAIAGGIPPRRMLPALLSVPAFSLLLAAPATLSVFTVGRPVLVLCHLGAGSWGPWKWPEYLAVTESGLFVAGRFLLRSFACVSLGTLLAASTKPQALFRGFRGLGIPSTFVLVLDMMVRYLALLLRSAEEIHLAKASRSIRRVSLGRNQAWAAAGIGELYRKSRGLAEGVGDAMVSRGYSGEARTLETGRWGWRETGFLASCAALAGWLLSEVGV